MNITRRNFLKVCSCTLTVAALATGPIGALEAIAQKKFSPKEQYGDDVTISSWEPETLMFARDLLMDQVREFIPRPYWHRVSFAYREPKPTSSDPLTQIGTVAWRLGPIRAVK